jgi:hypothetical protein
MPINAPVHLLMQLLTQRADDVCTCAFTHATVISEKLLINAPVNLLEQLLTQKAAD